MSKHNKKALNKAGENTVKVTETDSRDGGVWACNLEMLQNFQEVQEHAEGHIKETPEIQRKSTVMPREQNWKSNRGESNDA